jgi:hypothetical protein
MSLSYLFNRFEEFVETSLINFSAEMVSPLFYLSLILGVNREGFFSPFEPETKNGSTPFFGLLLIRAPETIKNQIKVKSNTLRRVFLVGSLSLLINVLRSK